MTTIAYQLYCSRKFPPVSATLKMLADAGYTAVEGYGGLLQDVDSLAAAMAENGLSMPSSHIGLDMVEGDPARTLEIVRQLGIEKVIVPHIAPDQRPSDAAGWAAFATRVAEAGKPFLDAGLVYGWHNHDFELVDLGDGQTPLDLLAAQDGVSLELDLGWVRIAGKDPAAKIRKYGKSLTAVHVKDIAPKGECADEDGWADVGHGIMDWPKITEALAKVGVTHLVAEHDNPNDDARFARRSLESIKNF